MYWKTGLMAAVILLLTTAGIAEISNNSKTDLEQVPAEYLLKAQSTLRVMCFVTGQGEALKCANTSMQAHGRKFTCNKGGFGGAMPVVNYIFGKDVLEKVMAGKTTWEQQIRSVLDNPANKECNVAVWSGSKTDKTETYLAAMDRLKKKYPDKQFVYMTGTLDAEAIRTACRTSGRDLLDAAAIGKDQIQAEWYLWARLAGWRQGVSRAAGTLPVDLVEDKPLEKLLSDGARLEADGNNVSAYVHFREAVKRAEGLSDVPFDQQREIRNARSRMRSLEIHAEVKKERQAGEQLSRESQGISRDIDDAVTALKKIARDHPETYTGQKAAHIADELSGLMNYIH